MYQYSCRQWSASSQPVCLLRRASTNRYVLVIISVVSLLSHCFIPFFFFSQIDMLVAGLCPESDDPAGCEAGLPDFWRAIAAILWPGYWDPAVSCTKGSYAVL